MISIKTFGTRTAVPESPNYPGADFWEQRNKEQLFKKMSAVVENNSWYLFKVKTDIRPGKPPLPETEIRSILKYIKASDMEIAYPRRLQFIDEKDVVHPLISEDAHDDIQYELMCKTLELNALEQAYEDLKSSYEEQTEKVKALKRTIREEKRKL